MKARALLAVVAFAAFAASPSAWSADTLPRALTQPAVQTPRALGAATLAVARAGARLVAVGERGTVLLSDDNGTTWRQAQVPVQTTLTAVRFADDHHGWAVGHLGTVLHSTDGGTTWTRQLDGVAAAQSMLSAAQRGGDAALLHRAQRLVAEGPDKPFLDIEIASPSKIYVVGAYGLAFETDDGGAHWLPITARLPNPKGLHLYGVRALGDTVVIAGEQGLLLRSTDNGASFTAVASPYKGSFFGLLATRDGLLLAHGLRGHAYRSADRGASWEPVDTGVTVTIVAGTELADGAPALLAQNGDVLISRDNGRSFARQAARDNLAASGLAQAADGKRVITSLRGVRRD